MKVKNVKIGIKSLVLCLLVGVPALSGCGQTGDAGSVVMIEQEREEIVYDLAAVTVGDVELTLNLRCNYEQAKDEDISFALSGKRIAAVYVKEGDHVEKGQLLAELSGGNLESEIQRLEYQIARNQLLLEHSFVNETDQISKLWLDYAFGYGFSPAGEAAVKNSVASLQQNYEYSREDYQDAIALDELQLAQYREELEQSRVYAGMTGTVTWLEERLEGSTSGKGEKIMTIIDSSECFFVTEEEENVKYFAEGMEIEVKVSSGTGMGTYTVVPYEMEKWDEKQTFTIQSGDEGRIIEVGTMGTMKLVLARKEGVLNIPKGAVHTADGKFYVYVLGENNMREIKWIETGLYGDDTVEVTAGLARGEKVVLR